jgi:hypothetical protein
VTGTNGRQIRDIGASAVPAQLNGLMVSEEDIRPTIIKGSNTYVSAAGLFSMRENDVVQATLEVGRFNRQADDANPRFQLGFVSQVGGSAPSSARVDDAIVYFTTASKQRVYVWFRNHVYYILLIRSDYPQPRSLLRAALAVQA